MPSQRIGATLNQQYSCSSLAVWSHFKPAVFALAVLGVELVLAALAAAGLALGLLAEVEGGGSSRRNWTRE